MYLPIPQANARSQRGSSQNTGLIPGGEALVLVGFGYIFGTLTRLTSDHRVVETFMARCYSEDGLALLPTEELVKSQICTLLATDEIAGVYI